MVEPDPAPAPGAEPAPEKAPDQAPEGQGKRKRRGDLELEADAESILGARERLGEARARKVGRAFGWTNKQLDKLLAPPAPARGDDPDLSDGSGGGEASPSPPPSPDGEGWKPARDPIKKLPDDCPVKPLGVSGATFWYLDPLQQLRDLSASDHSAMGLRALFGKRVDFLWSTFPKFSAATGNQNGWQADRATESLMNACAARGVFDGYSHVRGLGAWRGADGGLVLHAGDGVLVRGEWLPPGEYDGYLYPAYEPTPRPAETAEGYRAHCEFLLSLFDGWNWRAGLDPDSGVSGKDFSHGGHNLASLLLFGFAGGAIVGGALKWRPLIWLTGEAGSGKSTLLDVVKDLIGDIVKSADATPAGVWTALGNSTRAVLLDEVENDPHSPKTKRLVELARKASSGDVILRGSADHKGAEFKAQSSFLFSSIIIPPMMSQDRTRFAVLDLAPIEGGKALKLDVVRIAAAGRVMRRRILDRWADWPERLEIWRESLAKRGHSARGADQFGTLLAMADLIMHDEVADSDTRDEICAMIAPPQAASNAETMLNHLMSIPLEVFRGGTRYTVGQLVYWAAIADFGAKLEEDSPVTPSAAANALEAHGVYVARGPDGFRVVLPNQHSGLARLFEGSQWRTEAGATGGWAQAMQRLPGAKAENSRKFGGRGWSVPVKVFLLREGEGGA